MGGASKLLMLLSTPFPLIYPRPSALRLARHSRVQLASLSSVAAASSSHRRLLPSAPRPRCGFSVRAAEEVHTQAVAREGYGESLASPPNSRAGHPWPEWSKLVDYLVARGYYERRDSVAAGDVDDSFLDHKGLSEEFVKAAEACLAFARDRPDLLRLLPKKDLKVIVENGSPLLFRNGANSTRRLQSFLSGDGANVLEPAMAQTVDVMRYLLSYACNHPITLDENYLKARELIEASVRNLLVELVNVSSAGRESSSTESPRQERLRHEQFSRPLSQNIEMKRGDWICPTCSFMNFARNMRCLECNGARPKRVLTGGEWECPQCDFFNYGRNMSCLRCDCKRPGGTSVSTAEPRAGLGYGRNSNVEQILNRSSTDKSEIERKLAVNDEKAERWFGKVSQLDDSSDLSSAIADEDFPEIMPMRKGVNRFVVSTRKTPLERRLANAQQRGNLGNSGPLEGNESQPGGLSGMGSDKTSDSSISKTLDRILGRSTSPGTNHQSDAGEINTGAGSRFNSSELRQSMANRRRDPDHVPFVPLPADMFSKSQNSNNDVQQFPDKEDSTSMKTGQLSESVTKSPGSPAGSKNDNESSDASERWSKRVAELNNVTDLSSAVSDDDFPEIMPMRKGENRFVISKKKDRSLTSPQYKRRIALEQANNSNFVPFVPFPPDYFAKKDKQPEDSQTVESTSEGAAPPEKGQIVPEKLEEAETRVSNFGSAGNTSQWPDSQPNNESHSTDLSGKTYNESKVDAGYGGATATSAQLPNNTWNNSKEGGNSEYTQKSAFDGASSTASSLQKSEYSPTSRESWNQGFSGKSLEGSAVKEPDPLDMSEEAKAERWFRRVAQIKDISELSNIPDEDFPEIMPMRKGVNRFVVSKRKTPLERRLTSPQYRRNLPIVSSEPEKDAN
ncbi:zinc finger protein VAR3, chloroplastic [Elaeis guineensis]|uniref:Zinc finger protein VAR3, chloroplastic n=1 Tax=Elaeis guineensis var. tenera TaxID=51953 RepID=A0A6I9R9Q7_ELAGV|nr:zinc finger protein VAR3, chloroplastic [Elaeis guineensis]